MANELLTREDITRGKKNFDAFNEFIETNSLSIVLPNGKEVKSLKGVESEIKGLFPANTVGMRLSGVTRGRVPLAEDSYKASNNSIDQVYSTNAADIDCNDLPVGTRNIVSKSLINSPPLNADESFFLVETRLLSTNSSILQVAWGISTGTIFTRTYDMGVPSPSWSAWKHSSASILTYKNTTATAANVVVTSTGELQRSTSSRLFKDDIKEIDIPGYRQALRGVQPVSYRSTSATADRTDWHWYSFIAEDLAQIDPALVNMSNVEFFEDTDEDGNTFINTRELPDGEYAPDGLNLNGIVAMMARINQYMLDDIEALENEKKQLKSRMTKLENRMADLEKLLPAS